MALTQNKGRFEEIETSSAARLIRQTLSLKIIILRYQNQGNLSAKMRQVASLSGLAAQRHSGSGLNRHLGHSQQAAGLGHVRRQTGPKLPSSIGYSLGIRSRVTGKKDQRLPDRPASWTTTGPGRRPRATWRCESGRSLNNGPVEHNPRTRNRGNTNQNQA